MLLGTAKASITPPLGTPLAGYGFRDHGSESVLDDLELRVFWMQHSTDASRAACIVCADIIGFDASITTRLTERLTSDYRLDASNILLCASHTHSGPQTCANMVGVGSMVPEVEMQIAEAVFASVSTARKQLHPVHLSVAKGRLDGYSINRRVIANGHAVAGPNPDGVRDNEVTCIVFTDEVTGHPRAILFHFTCHPTTMGSYAISAEYPGAARRCIEKYYEHEVIAGFMPGCFGDVRPNCTLVGGKQFRRGLPEDIAAFGNALAAAVLSSMNRSPKLVDKPTSTSLHGYTSIVNLLHQGQPPTQTTQLVLHRLDLTDDISLVAIGGEVCCGYGHFIKQLSNKRTLIPLGYTNGITGYIPTAEMFAEGGYEVTDSVPYFGLPSPFDPSIDGTIRAAIISLLDEHE